MIPLILYPFSIFATIPSPGPSANLPYWLEKDELEAALNAGNARILENDPFDYLRQPEDKFPELHRQNRDEGWSFIELLVETETGHPNPAIFDKSSRGKMIAIVVLKKEYDARGLIYKYLRRYWQRGQIKNALLPDFDRCGGKGKPKTVGNKKLGRPSSVSKTTGQSSGINVDGSVKVRLRLGLAKFYELEGMSFRRAFRKTLIHYFHNGHKYEDGVRVPIMPPAHELPTERQARYLYDKEFKPESDVIARIGHKRFNLEKRPVLGTSLELVSGPGSLVEIDATPGDIYLVSELDRSNIIGKPIIYSVSDVFSKMIVGFAVVLDDGAGWPGMMLALENTMTDKVAFCARYDVKITPEMWPCHHVPNQILGDRGELEGRNATHLTNALGITIGNTAAYRGDMKGTVEADFMQYNAHTIRHLPGAINSEQSRDVKRAKLQACLTISDFTAIMIDTILYLNNGHRLENYPLSHSEAMLRDGVEPIPIQLWEWGIQHQSGSLETRPPDVIYRNVLPQDSARITRYGIQFRGLNYTCDHAEQQGWFINARHRQGRNVQVSYDPRRVGVIYVHIDDEDTMKLVECTLLSKFAGFCNCSWSDVTAFWEKQKVSKSLTATNELQSEAIKQARIDKRVQEAEKRHTEDLAKNPRSNNARLQGIDNDRKVERDHEAEKFRQSQGDAELSTIKTDQRQSSGSDAGYISKPLEGDLLEKVQQESLNQSIIDQDNEAKNVSS